MLQRCIAETISFTVVFTKKLSIVQYDEHTALYNVTGKYTIHLSSTREWMKGTQDIFDMIFIKDKKIF